MREHGVLKNHGKPGSAVLAFGGFADGQEIAPLKDSTAPCEAARRHAHKAHERLHGNRLARARLSHEAQGFVGAQIKAHTVDGPHETMAHGKMNLQVFDPEQGLSGVLCPFSCGWRVGRVHL